MNQVIEESFNEHHARFSKETTRSYRISLQQFFTFCTKPYDEVKATDIRTWLASMEGSGLKPKSINLKQTALKSFYRYCMEEDKLKKNPAFTVRSPGAGALYFRKSKVILALYTFWQMPSSVQSAHNSLCLVYFTTLHT